MGLLSGLLGGKTKMKKTTSTTKPLAYTPVEPALEQLIAAIQASMTGQLGQGGEELVAGASPLQEMAAAMLTGYGSEMAPFLQDIFGTAQFLSNPERLNVAEDPQLAAIASAITAPFIESLQQDVLPGIRDDFVGAGQSVNTPREREFQTRAMERTARAAGQAVSPLYENARQSNLDAMTKTIMSSPAIAGLPLTALEPMMQLGDTYRNIEQSRLNAPRDLLSDYGNILLQFPFGQTGTQKTPYKESGLLGDVGAVMGINAASKALGFGNIASWFGASDIRVKENVETVGRLGQLDVIEFEYVWEPGVRRRGLIAQQVARVMPDAVGAMIAPNGQPALGINYDMVLEAYHG